MNREIKFRAWCHDQGRMFNVYGMGLDFITEDTLDGVDPGVNCFDGDDFKKLVSMQYTGLKDKNGKEIYEGDIISVKEFKNELMAIIGLPSVERKEMCDGLSLDEIKGKLEDEYISEVRWEDGGFDIDCSENCSASLCLLFGDMKRSSAVYEFEIIGNIHQNPELLKGALNG